MSQSAPMIRTARLFSVRGNQNSIAFSTPDHPQMRAIAGAMSIIDANNIRCLCVSGLRRK